jgi:hypothetical protein
LTIIGARIGIFLIAIITGFNTYRDHSITTDRFLAVIETSIVRTIVTVVTGFITKPFEPVAAASGAAAIDTSVYIAFVGIVTLFISRLTDGNICPQYTVTAFGFSALIGTIIAAVPVAIITGFFPKPDMPVAATSDQAVDSAAILVGFIAVIASFVGRILHGNIRTANAIAATCGTTYVGAGISLVEITIVATLHPFSKISVATRGCDTGA